MCGICGVVGKTDRYIGNEMRDLLSHRGPDGSGEYHDQDIYLGNRRLAIVDVEKGNQPISNEDGTVILSYNGEIYNHEQLRRELEQKGHKFKTKSDGEVIIHQYEEIGKDLFSTLRGMFSISIWDSKRGLLLLSRDRLGIRPLYYSRVDGSLIFASEIKSILKHLGHTPPINWEAFESLLTLRYIPSPNTMFRGISKLPPGTLLSYHNGVSEIIKYWDLPTDTNEDLGKEEILEDIYNLLDDAVAVRLMGDVDVGLYLSGGVDSASILSAMTRHSKGHVNSFSAGFEDTEYDESLLAASTAALFSASHHTVKGAIVIPEMLKAIMWHLEEPLGDATVIPTYQLAGATSQYVKVVLSGEGADELFLGYPKYNFLRRMENYRGGLLSKSFNSISKIMPGSAYMSRLKDYLETKGGLADSYLNLMSVFTADEQKNLLTKSAYRHVKNSGSTRDNLTKFLDDRDDKDPVLALREWDIKYWLPDDLLLKNDKMNMAYGIEARLPFLDHHLVEYMLRLPESTLTRGSGNKSLFRKSMANVLPAKILRRKKKGFTVPLHRLYASQKEFFNDELFNSERLEEQGIFNVEYVRNLLSKDLSNVITRRQFWTIASFQLWWDVFIKDSAIDINEDIEERILELALT